MIRFAGLIVSILLIRSFASGVTVSHSGEGNWREKSMYEYVILYNLYTFLPQDFHWYYANPVRFVLLNQCLLHCINTLYTHKDNQYKNNFRNNSYFTFTLEKLFRGTIINNSIDSIWYIHHKHQPWFAGKACAGLHPRMEDIPPGGYTEWHLQRIHGSIKGFKKQTLEIHFAPDNHVNQMAK